MSATRKLGVPPSAGIQERVSNIREWQGVTAEAVGYHGSGGFSLRDLTSASYRLGVVLRHVGGRCEARSDPRASNGYPTAGRPFATLTLPGTPHWAYSEDVRFARAISISFDIPTFVTKTSAELRDARHLIPRLNLEHNRICVLAGLLAAECRTPGPYGEIYGESLITAILVELLINPNDLFIG